MQHSILSLPFSILQILSLCCLISNFFPFFLEVPVYPTLFHFYLFHTHFPSFNSSPSRASFLTSSHSSQLPQVSVHVPFLLLIHSLLHLDPSSHISSFLSLPLSFLCLLHLFLTYSSVTLFPYSFFFHFNLEFLLHSCLPLATPPISLFSLTHFKSPFRSSFAAS